MTTSPKNLGLIRVGIIQFPGSNCDVDCQLALKRAFEIEATFIGHQARELPQIDALVIPGGFSFGDYLRSGALAAHSRIMDQVREFAARGGSVIGICNGFQILVEAHILPGMLLQNANQQFICKTVFLKTAEGSVISLPIAHGEGRYCAPPAVAEELKSQNLVAFRYCDRKGEALPASNPNGSLDNIAGIFSKNRKVLGLMPHPERAMNRLTGGSEDGRSVWQTFLSAV